ITVLTFSDGVLLVDSGLSQMADKVLAAIKQLSDKPIAHIINTDAHDDHTGGNEKLARTGRHLPLDIVSADSTGASEGPSIVAHENVLLRMSAAVPNRPPAPTRALPTDTYHLESRKLSGRFRGGEAVQVLHAPSAHTDGDSIVYFRHADVLMTGDVFT